MPSPLFVRHGKLALDWDATGDLRIVREDNGMAILLSRSEWGLLLTVANLYGWPTAPPTDIRGLLPVDSDMRPLASRE